MSILSQLKPRKGQIKASRRVGRGESSGRGKTSGRGHKGQKSRTSIDIGPAFEGGQMPLHRRSPKWGFTQLNRRIYYVVNLGDIETKMAGQKEINPEALRKVGLIRNLNRPVKILGMGKLKTGFQISAHAFSESAKKAIESSKGSAVVIESKKAETAAPKTKASKKKA